MTKQLVATVTNIGVKYNDGLVDQYSVNIPCYTTTKNITALLMKECKKIDPNIVEIQGFWTDLGNPGIMVK